MNGEWMTSLWGFSTNSDCWIFLFCRLLENTIMHTHEAYRMWMNRMFQTNNWMIWHHPDDHGMSKHFLFSSLTSLLRTAVTNWTGSRTWTSPISRHTINCPHHDRSNTIRCAWWVIHGHIHIIIADRHALKSTTQEPRTPNHENRRKLNKINSRTSSPVGGTPVTQWSSQGVKKSDLNRRISPSKPYLKEGKKRKEIIFLKFIIPIR